MKVIEALKKVMELPANLAVREAQNKLTETTVLINGRLHHVYEIGNDYIRATYDHNDEVVYREVDSMEVWLPESGVYFSSVSNKPVFLQRLPNRQWRKSYSDTFYYISYLSKGDDWNGGAFFITEVDINSRKDFWVDSGREIWYHDQKVGYVRDSKSFICNAPYMEQELRDWSRGRVNYGN